MPAYTIDLSITAKDMASSAVNKVSTALSDMGETLGAGAGGVATGAFAAAKGLKHVEDGINNFIGAVQGSLIVQVGSQLNELGRAANIAETTFNQLAGSSTVASSTLADLRVATNGVVSDMLLMEGANRIMITGLADSADEIAGLTELGVKLSGAMGVDAASGMENFVAALNNMSYERLDTLGISASAVRERVNELKETGLDTQEAFKLATLEEGRKTLERLGDAANASATGTAKLNTQLQNLTENIGQAVNNTVEAAATSLDQLIQILQIQSGSHPAQVAARQAANEAAYAFASEWGEAVNQYMTAFSPTDYSNLSAEAQRTMQQAIATAYDALQTDPTLLHDRARFMEMLLSVPESDRSVFADAMYEAYRITNAEADNQAINAEREKRLQAEAEAQRLAAEEHANNYWKAYGRAWQQRATPAVEDMTARWKALQAGFDSVEQWQEYQDQVEQATDSLGYFMTDWSNLPSIDDITDPQQIEFLSYLMGEIETDMDNIKALSEDGLLNDDDLANAQTLVDNFADMQGRIADIQNMTVSGLLGQQSGGTLGELNQMIIDAAREGGASEEELEALKRTLELQSGEQTNASIVLQDQVVPMVEDIRKSLGDEAAAIALANVNEYLKQANFVGATPDQIALGLRQATGFTATGGASSSFTVAAGDTASGIAAKYGMTVDEVLAAAGVTNARLLQPGTYGTGAQYASVAGFDASEYANGLVTPETAENMGTMASDMQAMSDNSTTVTSNFEEINVQADELTDKISTLTSGVNVITARLVVEGLERVEAVLGTLGAMGGMNMPGASPANPRNNGGRVPGADRRTVLE